MNYIQATKIPVLMYHEIYEEVCETPATHKMTPAYKISGRAFEEHVEFLSKAGYIAVTLSDLNTIVQYPEKKYVIFTFDDGWIGNFEIALPVLKKFNFKAVFFVTGDFIGQPDFMTWGHLEKLINCGMLVQPHGMSHKPLQNLDPEDLYWELYESKRIVEQKLGIDVFSMSVPHGSYNDKVLKIGNELGYKIICTSDLTKIYAEDLLGYPSCIGRITMTHSMTLNQFKKIINYNNIVFIKHQLFEKIKKNIKRVIGVENYRRLYRAYYNISDPDDI